MIPILPDTAWREFRGQPKQGLNKTTHLAVIQDPAGKLRHCYVKMTPDDWPSPITEAIAYLIAEALDLPRPGFAALLFAPINKLKDCLKLDQHWLRSSHAIAFCCEAVPGRDLNQMWKWIADIRKAKFFRSPEVGQVAAFDLWTANQDRHTGNVIKSGGRYVPIDNEYILYPLLWNNVTFRVQFQTLLAEAAKYLPTDEHRRLQGAVVMAANKHATALALAAPRISQTISALIPDAAASAALSQLVIDFLHTRSASTWAAAQLGVIA